MFDEFSQFEVDHETQTQSFYEQSQQQLDSPNGSLVQVDFQGEFLKRMCNAAEIERMAANARTAGNTDLQSHDYDSQTDVETVVQTYMLGNPNYNENVAKKVSPLHGTHAEFILYKTESSFSFCLTHHLNAAIGYPSVFRDSRFFCND